MARIVHKSKGYAALVKHPALLADLVRRAEAVAEATGDDSIVAEGSGPIRKRNRAAIIATRGDTDNLILRNLDAGR